MVGGRNNPSTHSHPLRGNLSFNSDMEHSIAPPWSNLDKDCCNFESQHRRNFARSTSAKYSKLGRRNLSRGCTLNRRHSWPSLFDYHTLSSEYAINRRNRSEWVKLRRHDYFSDLSNDEVLLRVGPTLTNNRPTVPQQHCFGHLFQPRTRRRQRLRLDHSPTTDTSI